MTERGAAGGMGCLKWGCGGCGCLALLGVGFWIVSAVVMVGPFRRAVKAGDALEERLGAAREYVPPLDGAPRPDRIEAFLDVQQRLQPLCPELSEMDSSIQQLDRLDEDGEPSSKEVFGAAWNVTRTAFGVGGAMGRFFEARNTALGEVGMGLGEYEYLYLLAYREALVAGQEEDRAFGGDPVNRRIRDEIRAILANQLQLLRESPDPPIPPQGLEEELALLEADSDRLPWQDGPPSAIAESFAPFRARLDESFCAASTSLQLKRNRQRGLSIQAD